MADASTVGRVADYNEDADAEAAALESGTSGRVLKGSCAHQQYCSAELETKDRKRWVIKE